MLLLLASPNVYNYIIEVTAATFNERLQISHQYTNILTPKVKMQKFVRGKYFFVKISRN